MNKARRPESKTMNSIRNVTVEYVKDESMHADRRIHEATELIFQMLLLSKKRGRPAKNSEEMIDAA